MPRHAITAKLPRDQIIPGTLKRKGPRKFSASIGGFPGGECSVTLKQDGVEYNSGRWFETDYGIKKVSPTAEDWLALKIVLDQVDVWSWAKYYDNHDALDGTQWEFECKWGGQTIKTGGSNAYPGDVDARQPTTEESKRFQRFVAAISRFVGMPFE